MTGVRLVTLTDEHLGGLSQLVEDDVVRRFTRVPSEPPPRFARTWLDRFEQGRTEGTREGFAIVDGYDGSFLGVGVVLRIDRETRTTEIGYVVAPGARGRGVASEALGSSPPGRSRSSACSGSSS